MLHLYENKILSQHSISDVLVILPHSGYTFLKDDMSLGGKKTFETELTFT